MADETILTGDEGDTETPGQGGAAQPGQGEGAGGEATGGGGATDEGGAGKPGGEQPGGEAAGEGEGEGKGGEGEGAGKAGDGAEGAPESYEDFTVPDGVQLRDEDVQKFSGVARELGLTQEGAQRLVDLEAERIQEIQKEHLEAWQSQVNTWAEETRADQEVGGDHYEAATQTANRVLSTYGTDELKEVLNSTGLGNHPELVRVFARIGKVLSEDQLVTGGAEGVPSGSLAERLYPNQGKEAGSG